MDRLNWGNYDLIVIDESHNFRNGEGGAGTHKSDGENRYQVLMRKVIRAGRQNEGADAVRNAGQQSISTTCAISLRWLMRAMRTSWISELNTTKSIDEIFRQAQRAFNAWSELKPEQRTTDALLRTLDFDFFEVLDSVTIARSRKHIERYYDTSEIGKFPERLKPISLRPNLTDLNQAIDYNQIYELLSSADAVHLYAFRLHFPQ